MKHKKDLQKGGVSGCIKSTPHNCIKDIEHPHNPHLDWKKFMFQPYNIITLKYLSMVKVYFLWFICNTQPQWDIHLNKQPTKLLKLNTSKKYLWTFLERIRRYTIKKNHIGLSVSEIICYRRIHRHPVTFICNTF